MQGLGPGAQERRGAPKPLCLKNKNKFGFPLNFIFSIGSFPQARNTHNNASIIFAKLPFFWNLNPFLEWTLFCRKACKVAYQLQNRDSTVHGSGNSSSRCGMIRPTSRMRPRSNQRYTMTHDRDNRHTGGAFSWKNHLTKPSLTPNEKYKRILEKSPLLFLHIVYNAAQMGVLCLVWVERIFPYPWWEIALLPWDTTLSMSGYATSQKSWI